MSEIYFVKPLGLSGPIKIGYSYNATKRLAELVLCSPLPLEIIVAIPGTLALEHAIHCFFADCHSHHEWFHPVPRLLEGIEKLKAGAAIEDCFDLSQRTGTIRKIENRRWSPGRKLYMSYCRRLRTAAGRATRARAGDYRLPPDVDRIMERDRYAGTRVFALTPDDCARLEEVIADPITHCVPYENRFSGELAANDELEARA